MAMIILDNVTFHYDDPYSPVFEGLSLTLDTKWKMAIVGRNGSGKTTLLPLLQRQLQPKRGDISIPLEMRYFPHAPRDTNRPTHAESVFQEVEIDPLGVRLSCRVVGQLRPAEFGPTATDELNRFEVLAQGTIKENRRRRCRQSQTLALRYEQVG